MNKNKPLSEITVKETGKLVIRVVAKLYVMYLFSEAVARQLIPYAQKLKDQIESWDDVE